MNYKERPKCRKYIVDTGLQPFYENSKWDGYSACREPELTQRILLSSGLQTQMKKMVQEGYYNLKEETQ